MVARSAILERVIGADRGDMSGELARHVLTLTFSEADRQRYEALSEKAQAGALTQYEEEELDAYLAVNDFLALLKSKARVSLTRSGSAA